MANAPLKLSQKAIDVLNKIRWSCNECVEGRRTEKQHMDYCHKIAEPMTLEELDKMNDLLNKGYMMNMGEFAP